MSKNRLVRVVLCLLILTGCGEGFTKYTIEEVSQALYDEGVICSMELGHIEYPSDFPNFPFFPFKDSSVLHVYPFKDSLCLPERYKDAHGTIELFPSRRELRRVTRGYAESVSKGLPPYSEFIKGNVVIIVHPELEEEVAARFRRALESLE